MDYREQNNYPKAFAATGIVLAVVIALCYFIVFQTPPKDEDGTGGILVNYGTVDEGTGSDYMSIEEPSVAENANQTKPDKVTETPPTEEKQEVDNSDKNVVTQTNEDAPEVAANSKAPSKTVATQPVTKPVAAPKVNQNALYKGKTNNGTGEGDGTGSTPGNQGKTTGTTLTNNYNGTGSGNGGNLNLTQRAFVSYPKVVVKGFSGKVVVDIRVDKNGYVTYANAGAKGTTIVDADLLRKCEEALLNARFNSSETAADSQPGQMTFVFKQN
ncbi:energy transducer TonB [Mucilaginibacter sp.]|uniref:energy transducer TonB family protein n=1 Tax=Mucilaginibacter sp. TaxID=1882438 RepID=UPI003262DDC3